MHELVPPTFTGPFTSLQDLCSANLVSIQEQRLTEIEYVEKYIVVEDVDECIV
jgi:hypothetical protein